MARNPAQHILDADAAIERRQKERPNHPSTVREAIALESVADELTMLRAEVKYLREAMASIASSLVHKL